jgi:hypothetical protein
VLTKRCCSPNFNGKTLANALTRTNGVAVIAAFVNVRGARGR